MAHGKGRETYADGTVRHDGQWVSKDQRTEHTFLFVVVGLHDISCIYVLSAFYKDRRYSCNKLI